MGNSDDLFMVFLYASIACLLVILIDGWFLRPRRDPGAKAAEEPLYARLAAYALVALAVGMLWRLFRYEAVDFSLMLVSIGAVSGGIGFASSASLGGNLGQIAAGDGMHGANVVFHTTALFHRHLCVARFHFLEARLDRGEIRGLHAHGARKEPLAEGLRAHLVPGFQNVHVRLCWRSQSAASRHRT